MVRGTSSGVMIAGIHVCWWSGVGAVAALSCGLAGAALWARYGLVGRIFHAAGMGYGEAGNQEVGQLLRKFGSDQLQRMLTEAGPAAAKQAMGYPLANLSGLIDSPEMLLHCVAVLLEMVSVTPRHGEIFGVMQIHRQHLGKLGVRGFSAVVRASGSWGPEVLRMMIGEGSSADESGLINDAAVLRRGLDTVGRSGAAALEAGVAALRLIAPMEARVVMLVRVICTGSGGAIETMRAIPLLLPPCGGDLARLEADLIAVAEAVTELDSLEQDVSRYRDALVRHGLPLIVPMCSCSADLKRVVVTLARIMRTGPADLETGLEVWVFRMLREGVGAIAAWREGLLRWRGTLREPYEEVTEYPGDMYTSAYTSSVTQNPDGPTRNAIDRTLAMLARREELDKLPTPAHCGEQVPFGLPVVVEQFLSLMRQKGLEEVVVLGGAVRDAVLGVAPRDIDVTFRLELTASEMRLVQNPRAWNRLMWERVRPKLARLAGALGSGTQDMAALLRNGMRFGQYQWQQIPVHFVGPFFVEEREGAATVFRMSRIGAVIRQSDGALVQCAGVVGVNGVGVTAERDLVGCVEGLEDLKQRVLRVRQRGEFLDLSQILRLLALSHRLGFVLEDSVKEMAKGWSARSGLLSDSEVKSAEGALGELVRSCNKAVVRKELEELGIGRRLKEKAGVMGYEMRGWFR